MLNNLVAWAYASGRIYMKSDGTPWRPIVHIADISRAFITVLKAPMGLISGEAFNVGRSDENYQIRELAEIVHDTVPGSKIEYAKDGSPDTRCYRVDFSKINRVLPDFKPQWTARKGAKELLDAVTQAGLQLADFEGPRYKRISHIQELLSSGRLDANLRWREPVVA